MLTELNETDCSFIIDCIEYAMNNGDCSKIEFIDRARKLKLMLEERIEECQTARDVLL